MVWEVKIFVHDSGGNVMLNLSNFNKSLILGAGESAFEYVRGYMYKQSPIFVISN